MHVDYGIGGDVIGEDYAPGVRDAICRIKIKRPEGIKPDLARLEKSLRDEGCFDFYESSRRSPVRLLCGLRPSRKPRRPRSCSGCGICEEQ